MERGTSRSDPTHLSGSRLPYAPGVSPALLAAGRRRYVSLTTFRRSGVPVSTPVWVAPAGDGLVVTTGGGTGKAKRLRNDPRVELRECSRTGRVRPGAVVVEARADLITDHAEQQRWRGPLAAKYRLQWRITQVVERRLERPDRPGTVILRITDR